VLQPAVVALMCAIFAINFKEVQPPVHPKSKADVHVVLPIEDSCHQNSVAAALSRSPVTEIRSDESLKDFVTMA